EAQIASVDVALSDGNGAPGATALARRETIHSPASAIGRRAVGARDVTFGSSVPKQQSPLGDRPQACEYRSRKSDDRAAINCHGGAVSSPGRPPRRGRILLIRESR